MTTQDYVLGHTDAELDRLMKQAEFFGLLTEQVLQRAGLEPGMSVLDAGCGAGDVSLLAARLVGPTGRVLGIDRSEDGIALARRRAAALGYEHVTFRSDDLAAVTVDAPVDAVIGRLVLMYFPDPSSVLRRLASLVRPGGLVAFQEIHIIGSMSVPPCPLWDTSIRRIHDAFSRAGANPSMGLSLAQTFIGAGLPRPQMLLAARVESGPDTAAFAQMAGITRTLLPVIEKTGLGTAASIGVDDLVDRLRAEAIEHDATLVSPSLVGAWTRV